MHLLPSARSLLFGYYKKNRPQKGSYLVLLFSLAFSSSLSFAETIELPNNSGKIELTKSAEGAVVVHISGATASSRVFSIILDSPTRAVIDLEPPLTKLWSSPKFLLKESELFSALRLGTTEKKN